MTAGSPTTLRDELREKTAHLHRQTEIALDLMYLEDSKADVDLNVVATASGKIIEIQGTAEGEPIERKHIDTMVDVALKGIAQLCEIQKKTLASVGVDLNALIAKK